MTRDDIIRMAQEAGFEKNSLGMTYTNGFLETCLERFAAVVASAEREACARVCEQEDEEGEGPDSWAWHSKDFAKAIRARGNK